MPTSRRLQALSKRPIPNIPPQARPVFSVGRDALIPPCAGTIENRLWRTASQQPASRILYPQGCDIETASVGTAAGCGHPALRTKTRAPASGRFVREGHTVFPRRYIRKTPSPPVAVQKALPPHPVSRKVPRLVIARLALQAVAISCRQFEKSKRTRDADCRVASLLAMT